MFRVWGFMFRVSCSRVVKVANFIFPLRGLQGDVRASGQRWGIKWKRRCYGNLGYIQGLSALGLRVVSVVLRDLGFVVWWVQVFFNPFFLGWVCSSKV